MKHWIMTICLLGLALTNQNLEAQAEALFDKHFGPRQSIAGKKGKAEQFFEINIGK